MRNIYEINLLQENERLFSLFTKSLNLDSDNYLSQVIEAYVEKNKFELIEVTIKEIEKDIEKLKEFKEKYEKNNIR